MKHVIYGDATVDVTPRLLNMVTLEVGCLIDYLDGRRIPIPVSLSVMMSTMMTMAQGNMEMCDSLLDNIKYMKKGLEDIKAGK